MLYHLGAPKDDMQAGVSLQVQDTVWAKVFNGLLRKETSDWDNYRTLASTAEALIGCIPGGLAASTDLPDFHMCPLPRPAKPIHLGTCLFL